jgi:hypothetical protein
MGTQEFAAPRLGDALRPGGVRGEIEVPVRRASRKRPRGTAIWPAYGHRSEPLLKDDRAPLIAHVIFVEGHRDRTVRVGVQARDLGAPGTSPGLSCLKEHRSRSLTPLTVLHHQRIHHKATPTMLPDELRLGVRLGMLDPGCQPAENLAVELGDKLERVIAVLAETVVPAFGQALGWRHLEVLGI